MSFFTDPEVEEIAQNHIEAVNKIEESEAKRMLKRYREVRQELNDRLALLPDGSFTAQQLRGTLLQVELAIESMTKSLKEGFSGSAMTLGEAGVDDLVVELNRWNRDFAGAVVPINVNAVAVATDVSNFLFAQHESQIDLYGSSTYSTLAAGITNAMIQQLTLSEVVKKIGQYLIGEEWKLLRLARTELHNVYNLGKMRGMTEVQKTAMPDLMKTLMHPIDKRTGDDSKLAARLRLVVPIDEPFVYKWNGETREFMAPPDRPNDRAILVPYSTSWGEIPSEFRPVNSRR